jgi:hypothetical protein
MTSDTSEGRWSIPNGIWAVGAGQPPTTSNRSHWCLQSDESDIDQHTQACELFTICVASVCRSFFFLIMCFIPRFSEALGNLVPSLRPIITSFSFTQNFPTSLSQFPMISSEPLSRLLLQFNEQDVARDIVGTSLCTQSTQTTILMWVSYDEVN